MARLAGFPDETFTATQHIRDTTLVRFDSMFTPERKLWGLQNLQRFHALFVQRFEEGEGSFLDKFRKQLDGADDDLYQLAAELLYVQQFFTSLAGQDKKIENVRAVLSWCARPVPIPEWAVAGLKRGLAGDQSFNQHRPFHLAWLNEFLIHWHALSEEARSGLLRDPWGFAKDVRGVEFSGGAYQPMREAWLYLVFPDSFENISSRREKKLIQEAFAARLKQGPTNNVDADLLSIRRDLEPQEGQGFHFYRSPIVEQWRTKKKKAKVGEIVIKPDTGPSDTGVENLIVRGEELFLDPPESLASWSELLLESQQMIFQGPPGTGKTFLARELALAVAGHRDRVQLVQFHPSYAYEDFVEGYRPTSAGGFSIQPGPLKRLASMAAKTPGERFVLLTTKSIAVTSPRSSASSTSCSNIGTRRSRYSTLRSLLACRGTSSSSAP